MLPTFRKHFQDASRSFAVMFSACAVASRTFGPPVCITQLLMSLLLQTLLRQEFVHIPA